MSPIGGTVRRDPAVRRQALIDGIRARAGALLAAEGFCLDNIIDPRG